MEDINGITINVGDKVKTQQPSGGILPPAKPKIGVVEKTKDPFGHNTLQIRYRKEGKTFDSFILLEGKINKVII